jgi:hypothetical protein
MNGLKSVPGVVAAVIVIAGSVVCLSCSDDDDNAADSHNRPPQISSMSATPDTIMEGDITTVVVVAADPDGHSLSYEWESRASWLTALTVMNGTVEMHNCCPISGFDSTYVIVTVSDGHGAEASDSVEVWVVPR